MLTYETLLNALPNALSGVDVPGWGARVRGKVRDGYHRGSLRALVTTDRVSAFDRVLGLIPYKGQVLNQLSLWWFEQTRDLVANHVVAAPDPNVTIGREAKPLPVEVVVRGYLTGVTSTSLWTMYANGERKPYGVALPDGLNKDDALPTPVITPTTKATDGGHDRPLTRDDIINGILPAPLWDTVEAVALALFARGQAVARKGGLILVDTKYEFGLIDGQLTLIDEVHTPDSSRYWVSETVGAGREPENLDKEYLRKWYVAQGYRGDGEPPAMPPEFAAQVAARYIDAYERLTKQTFTPAPIPAAPRIERVLGDWRG
ncbi:MAG: phosphoribosylaminoimidazolesuccinocarboxamide synthase [Anaerolineae bacterium]|jgi:phosphoribosylaminoimidazole-succinocarboxamide synthase|nr:phosphoribosylaminoimidazolesuccinocarboxamide synthase [Anaerolineae bacterium]